MLFDDAIIGADPYGLAAATDLRQIKGLSVAIHWGPMKPVFASEDPVPGLVEFALIPYLSVKRGF